MNLLPCPFCGEQPQTQTYDRVIIIECKKCDYNRYFKGLITTVPHKTKVNDKEYYNPKAHDEAEAEWNKRAT